MFRLIIPLILIALALALVFGFIRPQYAQIEFINSEIVRLEEALDTKDQAEAKIKTLTKDIKRVSDDDKDKIAQLLPFEKDIDIIVIINDINNIAMKHGMILQGVRHERKVVKDEDHGSYNFIFDVRTKYEEMRAFISDLEKSETIFNISKIFFK